MGRNNATVLLQPIIRSLCYTTTTSSKSRLTTTLQRNHPQYQLGCCTCLFSTNATSTTPPNEFHASQLPQHQQQYKIEERQTQQQQPTERRKQLIACKIYMNVGGDVSHVPVLNDLILRAQTKFATNNTSVTTISQQHNEGICDTTTIDDTRQQVDEPKVLDFTRVGVLVRVDMDPRSNRSSLHLAGPVFDVISMVKELIEIASPAFQLMKRGCKVQPDTKSLKAAHKVVDIVEHVSFLPLLPEPQSKITDNKNLYPPHWVPTYTSYAAREVGKFIREKLETQVFFYGYAQRNNVSFENIVDRRMKKFSLLKNNIPASTLVGAFPDYVEDIHVLLAAQCGKQRVRELVKLLNNTDTGLTDVVATAQLYDLIRWDIHCRLLRPHTSGSNMAAIEHVLKRWTEVQNGWGDQIPIEFVVKCFRVGPTYDECINALHKVNKSEKDRIEFDQEVREIFQSYADYYATSITKDKGN